MSHLQTYDVVGVAGTSLVVNSHWGQSGPPYAHGQIIHRPANESALDRARMAGFIYLAAGLQQPVIEGIQALDGVFIATHRHVWEKLRYDEGTFDGFHVYDIDFTYRAYLMGYRIAIPLDLLLIHFSTGSYSGAWDKYNVRFLQKFPALSNVPGVEWYSSCNVKAQTLDHVERLHAGFLFHRYGAVDSARNVPHH
jgi:Glycosyltransferase like family